MKKNLFLGIILGFGLYYLFEKKGIKKCLCKKLNIALPEKLTTNETFKNAKSIPDPNPSECEKAVDQVMAEYRLTSKNISEEAFESLRADELKRCMELTKSNR